MNAMLADDFSRRLPDSVEIENADHLRHVIAGAMTEDGGATLRVVREPGRSPELVTLTPAIARTLLDLLRLVSSGNGFMMIPVEAQLTTQQAADLLNVSRPYFVKLLDRGEMPHEMVGRHRRVKAEDLFAYKERRDIERDRLLAEMADADAEVGLL